MDRPKTNRQTWVTTPSDKTGSKMKASFINMTKADVVIDRPLLFSNGSLSIRQTDLNEITCCKALINDIIY